MAFDNALKNPIQHILAPLEPGYRDMWEPLEALKCILKPLWTKFKPLMLGIYPADLLQKPLVNINDKTDGLIILCTDVTRFEVNVQGSNLLLSSNSEDLPDRS